MFDIFLQAQSASSGGGASVFFVQFAPLLLIFVVFYFLLIRPQQRRMKDHQTKIGAVKKGDTIVTGGGLIGKVVRVSDGEVEVEIASGVKVRVVQSTVADVLSPTGTPAND